MSFALKEARLWRQIERTAVALSPLEPRKDNNEDRMQKIYTSKEKICEFQDKARKTVAKIGKMCIDIV